VTQRPQRQTGLVTELQRSHRFTVLVLVSVLVLSLATSGYLILVSQPRLAGYVELTRQARDVHEAMLDQETGLRGWLATGDEVFLEPYLQGRNDAKDAVTGLLRDVRRTPHMADLVVSMLLSRQEWQNWASEAAGRRLTPRQRTDGTLTAFLLEGKSLFDAYRTKEVAAIAALRDQRTAALALQRNALVAVLASYLLLLGASAEVSRRRRHHLQGVVLAPIAALQATIGRLREGDLTARAPETSVTELAEVGTALGQLAAELDDAGTEATDREIRLAFMANRFETVVRVGREIAGSLSIRYVSATVATAAAELLGTTATLWVRGADDVFQVAHRSTDPHGVVPPQYVPVPEVVQTTATDALPTTTGDRRAYPLVLAGRVTAVLEVGTPIVDEDTEQVLASLLSTAAASLESAHLHSAARELADMDGLTALPNRRRFELDIDTEWERCRRYGRPLSMVMMDLDHFKALNDEHGHLLGDEVLRTVAQAISSALRSTDTAYRYGGEELVVMLRETGLEDAAAAAERLRAAVAAVVLDAHPDVRVTTSAGVAARHSTMSHYTGLVEKADKALYEAKRLGRDRVAVDGLPPADAAPYDGSGTVVPLRPSREQHG
jgi:diguanylate cyclase (GGDEF)-like protein